MCARGWSRLAAFVFYTTLAAAASPSNWIPIRWWDPSPSSLDLLQATAINCLLLPDSIRSQPLIREAHQRWLTVLALASNPEGARRAAGTAADGIVLEGDFAATFQAPGFDTPRCHISFASRRFLPAPRCLTPNGGFARCGCAIPRDYDHDC